MLWTHSRVPLHRGGQGFESLCAHLNTPSHGGVCIYITIYGGLGWLYLYLDGNLMQRDATISRILFNLLVDLHSHGHYQVIDHFSQFILHGRDQVSVDIQRNGSPGMA
jgi:hypothetical protein